MKNFEEKFRVATATTKRDVLLEQILANPSMTLGELMKLAAGEFKSMMKEITVGDLINASRTTAVPKSPTRSTPTPASKAEPLQSLPRPVNTRTPAGRDAYDESVYKVLSKTEPRTAEVLGRLAQGTSLQLRASLNRLIESGRATWEGKARGTKYSAV